MKIEVDQSDLEKIYYILKEAAEHHKARDDMNSRLHLAKEVLFSPLTSELLNAVRRLSTILGKDHGGG